jgi:putative nucleotidyltransferase with HDIG domain
VRQLVDFHHYNYAASDSELTRVERLERRVIRVLLSPTALGDDERESSVAFELKHSSGTLQFARALARKRLLNPDSAAAGALLHDIYVIEEGKYKDHAALGAPIAREYMEQVGEFNEQEIVDAETLVANHSDKHVWSDDPYGEFGKDVDVLDCFLYPGAFEFYLIHKPYPVFFHYLKRAKHMWRDLNLPEEPIHTLLDEYEPGSWMPVSFSADGLGSKAGAGDPREAPPPYAIFGDLDAPTFRAPSSSRVDRGEIVDHARSVVGQIRASGVRSPVLVFPALERWTPLTGHEATRDLGGEEFLQQLALRVTS